MLLPFQEKDGGVVKYGQNDVSGGDSVGVVNLPADDTTTAADVKPNVFNFMEIMRRQISLLRERQRQEQLIVSKALESFNNFFKSISRNGR